MLLTVHILQHAFYCHLWPRFYLAVPTVYRNDEFFSDFLKVINEKHTKKTLQMRIFSLTFKSDK